jgi:hypothetical protein
MGLACGAEKFETLGVDRFEGSRLDKGSGEESAPLN